MIDIIYPEAEKQAKKLGIKPLIIGKEITIANTRKEIQNAETLIVLTTNLELIEEQIDGITNIENNPKNDHTHFRRGGLDQINTKKMKENNTAYIINIQAIKNNNNPEQLLGRIQQNIKLCNKNNIQTLLFSFAKKNEELNTKQDQEAFNKEILHNKKSNKNQQQIQEWLKQAQKRATKEYLGKGIKKTL